MDLSVLAVVWFRKSHEEWNVSFDKMLHKERDSSETSGKAALPPQRMFWGIWRRDCRAVVCCRLATPLSTEPNLLIQLEIFALRFFFQSPHTGETTQLLFDSTESTENTRQPPLSPCFYSPPYSFLSSLVLGKGTQNGWWEIFGVWVCVYMCGACGCGPFRWRKHRRAVSSLMDGLVTCVDLAETANGYFTWPVRSWRWSMSWRG